MKTYDYNGPVTAFQLVAGSVVHVLLPGQEVELDEANTYVVRLVARGHLVEQEEELG